MAWQFTTSGAAIAKSGANNNADIAISGARLAEWSSQSEARIMAETRKDFSGAYSNLNGTIRNVLSDISSSMIAKQIIAFDMAGYTSRFEAITMLNLQDDIIRTGIAFLKDFKAIDIKAI